MSRRKALADLWLGDPAGELWRAMLLIRRFEEKAGQMFAMGLIGGFCHLCIGQEAIAVGMRQAARPGDQFIASYRMHGHLLASGADPRAVMAELVGRRDGLSRGKGGSMHMFAPELDFFGGHGIVAAQASIGTGLAFANAYRGDGKVCVAFLGDGAADQGQLAESFVMAERWSLPIVYVIENNRPQFGRAAGAGRSRRRLQHPRRDGRRHVPDLGARGRRAGAGLGARRQRPEFWKCAPNATAAIPSRSPANTARRRADGRPSDGGAPIRSSGCARGFSQMVSPQRRTCGGWTRKSARMVADTADQAASCDEPEAADLMTDILL